MQHTQDLLSLSPFPPQPMYILKIWRKILTGLGFGVTCSYSSRPFLCTLVVSSPASSPLTGTCMHDMVCLEVELCCSLKLTTQVAPFWQGLEPQSLLQFEPVHNNMYSAMTYFGYKDLKTLRWASPPCLYHFCLPNITDISDKIFQVFRTGIMDAKAILKVIKAWERSHLVASFWVWGINFIPPYHPNQCIY